MVWIPIEIIQAVEYNHEKIIFSFTKLFLFQSVHDFFLNKQIILKLVTYLTLKLAQLSNGDPYHPLGRDKLEMQ